MSDSHWSRVTDLIGRALDRPALGRLAWVRTEAARDPALLAEVARLLDAHMNAGAFLEQPLLTNPDTAAAFERAFEQATGSPAVVGATLGRYRLLRELGRGGMGTVYLATRADDVFEKHVAIKVVPGARVSELLRDRFARERHLLALLEHPGIARVIDGGATDEGLQYLVMEYVEGVPIDVYCQTHALDVNARLRLLLDVCKAVQYAHGRLIVHRDIKPSNILVAADGRPRLLDFGIGKLLAGAEGDAGSTLLHAWTPETAAPEQVRSEPATTATDVYGLGTLLFRLLTGHPVFDVRGLNATDRARVICETPPEAPSVIGRRDPTPATGLIARDLDRITLKALHKDPAQRYASVAHLADDLERHLTSRPVLAAPDHWTYRAGKFVRRHRVGVAACAAIVTAFVVGIAGTVIGLVRAQRAEAVAAEETETARQVSDFLVGLFEVSDPGQARGNSITAREVLETGAAKLDRELADRPLVRARLMDTIGRVYQNLGLYGRAEPLLLEALNVRRHERGDTDLQVGRSLLALAWLYRWQGRYAEGESLSRRGLEIVEAHLDPHHPDVGLSLRTHGVLLRDVGSLDAARPILERALSIAREARGEDHVDTAMAQYHLGWLLNLMSRYQEARRHYERALPTLERRLGPDSPLVAWCLNDLAVVLENLGDYDHARPFLERSLAIREKVLGPDHPDVASALNNLGALLWFVGRYDEARVRYERALAIREEALGPQHPEVAHSLLNLALVFRRSHDSRQAVSLLGRSASILEATRGVDLASVLMELATAYGSQARYAEAAPIYQRSVEIFDQNAALDHPDVAFSQACYFAVLGRQQRALELLKRAVTLGYRAPFMSHPDLGSLRGLPEFETLAAANRPRGE